MARALFVVIDGVDGCGKSTQAERLVRALAELGRGAALHLREPGSTALGERLREILLGRELALCGEAEALLFCAARAQMLREKVAPALARGVDVVCERFHPSTVAYQASAGGLDEEAVAALLEQWAGAPAPDLVLVLAVDPARARERVLARGARAAGDRFESRGAGFQADVAAGLARWVERARRRGGPGRALLVDGDGSADEVHARVLAEVRRAL
jgi:dTMP kinase